MFKRTPSKRGELLSIAEKLNKSKRITPNEITTLIAFELKESKFDIWNIIKQASFFLSLGFGAFLVMYPDVIEIWTAKLPSFLYLPERLAHGLDYLWSILGNATEQTHILYHLPNILLYSFGIFGIRSVVKSITKKNWKDLAIEARTNLKKQIAEGTVKLKMPEGFSILFLGQGDYVGESLSLNPNLDTVCLITKKLRHTKIWNKFDLEAGFEDLKEILININANNAGEYIFFPVTDQNLFLPGLDDYDIAPHKLDVLIKNLRSIEKVENWVPNRIIILGDKYQKSYFHTEDINGVVKNTEDLISFEQLSIQNANVSLIDPTDLVLKKILEIANGRKISFRASKKGLETYKQRFFMRLISLGYSAKKEESLTIGYDLFEDQTEQQSLSHKDQSYLPVVLSQDVYDALLRHGYTKDEILFIPDLVLEKLHKEATKQ